MAAAKEAFPGWSTRSPEQRAQVLNKLADLMEAHLEEFAQAESRDQGDLNCFKTCCINPGVSQILLFFWLAPVVGIKMAPEEIGS